MNDEILDPLHEVLLEDWAEATRAQGLDFIKDGAIDSVKYGQAAIKVLFLLKEAYQSGKSPNGFDLRRLIRERTGPKSKTWHTAARWSYIAQGGAKFPVPKADAKNALLHSAIVNIKKSGGTKRSNMKEIRAVALRDGVLIKKQIMHLAPNIVVCGNTWGAVKHLWAESENVSPSIWRTEGITFIDYWHPANFYPNDLNDLALFAILSLSKTAKASVY